MRNALLRRPLDRPLADERGVLLEHLVACELYRRQGTLWPELELFYFRTQEGLEVDFLARAGRELWAIEVKSARSVTPAMIGGLKRVHRHVRGIKRSILVFLGDRAQRIGEVEVLPLRDFLAQLPS